MVFSSHAIAPRDRKGIPLIIPYQVLATSLAPAASAHGGCAHQFPAESLVGICPWWAFAHAEMLAAVAVGKTRRDASTANLAPCVAEADCNQTPMRLRRSAAASGGIGCAGSRRQSSAVVLRLFAKFPHGSHPSMRVRISSHGSCESSPSTDTGRRSKKSRQLTDMPSRRWCLIVFVPLMGRDPPGAIWVCASRFLPTPPDSLPAPAGRRPGPGATGT